jgi:flagellar L-ring protein precursor FlgH
MRGLRGLGAALGAALLAGCFTLHPPRVELASTPPPVLEPAPPTAATAGNGSIYASSVYRPLFEDHRARLVGDTLNVQIVEKVSASQKSTSSVDKSGNVNGAITALPGINPNSFGRATLGANSANTFAGKGATETSNDFTGTITAIVTGVLPNGHLIISGEKQIGVNSNVDVLRFTGQVDPRAIQPGNSVPSAQVANVRLEHRGRGQQADANAIGWLQRIFLSVLPL